MKTYYRFSYMVSIFLIILIILTFLFGDYFLTGQGTYAGIGLLILELLLAAIAFAHGGIVALVYYVKCSSRLKHKKDRYYVVGAMCSQLLIFVPIVSAFVAIY